MTDHFDDDSAFWDSPAAEPTIQLNRVRRTTERTRTHHVVKKDATPTRGTGRSGGQASPDRDVDESREYETVWVEPATGGLARTGRGRARRSGLLGNVDPRLLSVGALSVAAVLTVPLFGALGDKDGNDDDVRSVAAASSTVAPTATTLAPTTTAVVITAPVDGDDDDGSDGASRSASAGDAPSDESGGMSSGSASGSSSGSGDGESAGGGVLAAPAVRVAAQCGNPYEVAAGDYWMGIATKIDYPVSQLLDYNEATADTPLYPGSVVCLPLGSSIAPPATEAPATTAAPATEAPTTQPAPDTTDTTVATTQPATTDAPATTRPLSTTQAPDDDDDDDDDVPSGPVPSGGSVEQMIRDIWPDDQEERALRIAWRESNYRPDVTSGTGCCHGVFQMHEQHLSWLADYGVTSVSQLFDARTNIQAAYYLYQRSGGWGPWALG